MTILVGVALGALLIEALDLENPTPSKVIMFIGFSAVVTAAAVVL